MTTVVARRSIVVHILRVEAFAVPLWFSGLPDRNLPFWVGNGEGRRKLAVRPRLKLAPMRSRARHRLLARGAFRSIFLLSLFLFSQSLTRCNRLPMFARWGVVPASGKAFAPPIPSGSRSTSGDGPPRLATSVHCPRRSERYDFC